MSAETMPGAATFVLAGGMGAGKSTFGKLLESYGAVRIDADDVVRELRKPGEPGYEPMIEILGEDIVATDGTLDTAKIADVIFSNSELLDQLEETIHPLAWESMLSKARKLDEKDIAVFEVPLPDKNTVALTNGMVAVITPREKAIARLIANRGYTREQAIARIKLQRSNEELTAMADHVVNNDGTKEDLEIGARGTLEWMRKTAHLL